MMVRAEPSTVEVVMARPPSVYVRELTPEEGQQLRRLSRRSKVFATRQRAQILLASDSHMAARQIADVLRTDENQVRRVIHEFNADGMASLRPPTGGGRPRRIDEPTRMRIRDIALARPGDLGEPGTRWSLARLRRYLMRRRVVGSISVEHLRRILRAHNVTAQRTRTWKTSTDPLYEAKRAWVVAAYQAAEAGTLDGVVVSFDECGPISLRPWPGRCWARQRRTQRMRATYTRTQGTRKFLAAYDVGADHLWGHLEARRVTGPVVLEFLHAIRARYPVDVTVYIVMDNLSAHWVPDIRRWAGDVTNNVALLPTPTNASHLNRVECHLCAFVEFVINGSDHPDWATFAKATHFYIRRRNHDHHDTRIRDFENRRKIA
jgi:transposase